MLRIVAVCAYLGALVGLGVLEHLSDYPIWAGYLPWVLTFALGLAIGRWWALLISAAMVLVSIPFFGIGDTVSAGATFVGVTAVGVGVRLAVAQTSRDFRAIRWQTVLVVIAYVAVMGGFMVYAASLDTDDDAIAGTVVFLAAQALVGLALGRWRAVFLVAVLPILAIPVPTPEEAYEPLPLWFAMLVFAPFIAGLIAAGVAARKLWQRWRSSAVVA